MHRRIFSRSSLAVASLATGSVLEGRYYYLNSGPSYPLPSKETAAIMDPAVQEGDARRAGEEWISGEFDVLIVGGGATGAGVAVDAATRGLKVAPVERDDFSSGTSSKSTKLVHGGVRYLQKAAFELDYEQYKLVKELYMNARSFCKPHLIYPTCSLYATPIQVIRGWQVPYYWIGCKMCDILAGKESVETSYLMTKVKAPEAFLMLKSEGLVGALVYYDGQHNDSRMNMALITTAVKHGAVVANHTDVVGLLKDTSGQLNGARVRDNLTRPE